ncbi:hypothetical protein [Winogradskyella ursingii]|uniref:hypothetical protein n=1 Tax=Winogradskyella ursingii TaxID=2686079 RepID=UPI0015C981AF|nr:hypothetical protein [Winogradskyella ursingii]
MGFLSKLLGSKSSDVNVESDDTVAAIIENVENPPYGVSEHNVLYAGLKELGGYYIFQTLVIGALNIKTKKGAKLKFSGTDFELKLNSDMPELESEPSDLKGRYVTPIDFQIEEYDIEKLKNAELKSVQLTIKNQELIFEKAVILDEEE